jgi:hypothetical protein
VNESDASVARTGGFEATQPAMRSDLTGNKIEKEREDCKFVSARVERDRAFRAHERLGGLQLTSIVSRDGRTRSRFRDAR